MSITLEELEAQNSVVGLHGDLPLVAAELDSLAAYEQAARSCAAAMIAEGGMADAAAAALSSLDVVSAAADVITRASGDDGRLERQMLEAVITACERSESQCSAHAHHHDHCRLHTAAARHTIKASKALLADLT